MVRAEDPGSPVSGMLVQAVNSSLGNDAPAVADEKIVEDQPGQGMKGVPPGGPRGRHPEGKPRLAQKLPGRFVSAASQVEIGAENHSVVKRGGQQMAGLSGTPCRTQPAVAGRTSGVEMGADEPDPPACHRNGRRNGHPALQYERQLGRLGLLQRQARQNGVPPVALQCPISHGWGIPEVETQRVSCFDYVFLGLELGHQNAARGTRRDRRDRGVTAVGFLNKNDER